MSSAYITPEGFATLQAETTTIWKKRARVTVALSAAAAEGDRSENAEYIYRKKELREIDRRIRYLQKRLPDLKVVNRVGNEEQIFFGAWVTLESDDASTVEYRIVGGDEIDSNPRTGHISFDSPMAKALLKKRVGDDVTVQVMDKQWHYVIGAIRYSKPVDSQR